MMRSSGWLWVLSSALALTLAGTRTTAGPSNPEGEWRHYGGDSYGSRYSPLKQINKKNFKNLKLAWTWDSIDEPLIKANPDLKPGPNEGTPIMVGGVLYVSTGLNQVAAIDGKTGKTLWAYNSGARPAVHRGVEYWEGPGASGKLDRRILIGTSSFHLVALNADTGKPIPTFGNNGSVDLLDGLSRKADRGLVSVTSPPVVCSDVVVVGSAIDDFQSTKQMPPGDVQGFDVRTGKRLWTFHTIPLPGEFGADTWENGSNLYTGNANVWTCFTADPELGYVYLPVSTPNNDWYGGHRPGSGLFGESVVCIDAKTGKRVWHYQLVHHGLWDYDLPCAPNLIDVTVDGKRVKAVAQVTKQAFTFVFDRVTGKPLWPIEERPVPQGAEEGDRAWPTQPFPTKPAPFDRQSINDENLIDYTPELKAMAKEELKNWNWGPLYTPPTRKKTIEMPGWVGGASWAGAAADPETGILYVPSVSNPMFAQLAPPDTDGGGSNARLRLGANGYRVLLPNGLPLVKGPYGRITAIDLNKGEHRWMVHSGRGPVDHPAIKHLELPPQGMYHRTYCLVTKTLLLTTQEGGWFNTETPTEDPVLRAYDKKTGRLLAEVPIPAHPTGAPMTYMAGGKQFVAIPIGGNGKPSKIVAMAFP